MTATDFHLMVTRHEASLHPFAVSLTQDTVDAKDLYQETMYRALLYRDKYEFGTNLKAWLSTIMRNTFINQYRRRKRFPHAALPEADWAMPSLSLTTSNGGWARLRHKEIRAAIAALPELYRLSFELYFTGYKYAEIAELLREPLGTIKSRIHLARKSLVATIDR